MTGARKSIGLIGTAGLRCSWRVVAAASAVGAADALGGAAAAGSGVVRAAVDAAPPSGTIESLLDPKYAAYVLSLIHI